MENADLSFIVEKFQQSGRELTPQRRACYEYFVKLTEPTDAESIWLQLRASGLSMSRETVYNALHLLIELKCAERRFNPDRKHYEYHPVSIATN